MHILSAAHRTDRGIGIGSTRSCIIDAYGTEYVLSPFAGSFMEFFDGERYLAFMVTDNDVVLDWSIRQESILELHARRR